MTTYTLPCSQLNLMKNPIVMWCNSYSIRWKHVWVCLEVHIDNEIDNVAFKLKFGQYIVYEEIV